MKFMHQNIHKYAWTSPDWNTDIWINHILIDRRWHSNILDVQSFRGADWDTAHCLVVAKVRERLAVSKQDVQKFDGEWFNLWKLNELDVRKQYQIEIMNKFAALENLRDDEDVNRAWENIKGHVKTSAKERSRSVWIEAP